MTATNPFYRECTNFGNAIAPFYNDLKDALTTSNKPDPLKTVKNLEITENTDSDELKNITVSIFNDLKETATGTGKKGLKEFKKGVSKLTGTEKTLAEKALVLLSATARVATLATATFLLLALVLSFTPLLSSVVTTGVITGVAFKAALLIAALVAAQLYSTEVVFDDEIVKKTKITMKNSDEFALAFNKANGVEAKFNALMSSLSATHISLPKDGMDKVASSSQLAVLVANSCKYILAEINKKSA